MKPFKIVFMGTPDFAVAALNALHESVHEVVLVATQPDRPKGRGRKMVAPPVKAQAVDLGYESAQPTSLNEEGFIDFVESLEPDFFVVVAFGRLLTRRMLRIPKIGAVNVHASLLPEYRGSAPIHWAIADGRKETGVTTMLMDEGMDTGDILLTETTGIGPEDTSETLHDRLALSGASLLVKTLEGLARGDIQPIPQDDSLATHAPMLKKSDGRIDWSRPASELDPFIRGMTPWPGAFTFHGKKRLKIFKAVPVPLNGPAPPGAVVKGFSDELRVAAGADALSILEIQSASGKRLPIKDFLRGCRMDPGEILG